jgi:hypothetical protein
MAGKPSKKPTLLSGGNRELIAHALDRRGTGSTMSEIHGVRVYPDSVNAIPGSDAQILVHGAVADDCTDFFYIFRHLAGLWRDHYFATDFALSFDENGQLEDPMPKLRASYGPSLVAADPKTQLVILSGDHFLAWGAELRTYAGAFLPIFSEIPSFDLLGHLYWQRTLRLSSRTWPAVMRAALHMWDDIYWQLFSTIAADVDQLIKVHERDSKLAMYYVDFDREYPDPSNQELRPVKGS